MSNFARIQLSDSGEEVSAEELARSKEVGHDLVSAKAVRINEHAQHNGRVQLGADTMHKQAAAEAQAAANAFIDELDRLESVVSSGAEVPKSKLEYLQHRLNDTAIAYVRGGGTANDPELLKLREYVNALASRAMRRN